MRISLLQTILSHRCIDVFKRASSSSVPAPAEVVERYVLDSTDGPIEHATVLCSERRRYTVLVERLQTPRTPERRTGRWAPR